MEQTFDWNAKNILDDTKFKKEDLEEFKKILGIKEKKSINIEEITIGQILNGTIVEVGKEYVVIDVGLKSEGLVPISEFKDKDILVLGNKIEVFLDKIEGANGQVVLSREKARKQKQWENILNNYPEGSIISGKIIRKVKGGLIVDIGIEAFLPGSQIDNKRIKNLDDFINHTFNFKILKINTDRKNIVISRREALEDEMANKKTEVLDNIKPGELIKGTVKNITDFGAFLDLNGIDGLLHITDMNWKRIRHPSEMVKIGQELEVIVLNIDKDKSRIALGLKQKQENPWEEIEKKYPVGTHIKGKIVNLVPYGAFIEIEKNIEGLIHISEMSWTKNITDPSEMVNIGDEVDAVVLAIQKEDGKISLGMKQLEKNPWEDVEKKYKVGNKVHGEIRNLTNYGAFVELEPGIDGLIHISDVSWIKKISHPSEEFKIGDKINAVVLSVDKESKKITLGVKQLTINPWESIEKKMPVGSIVSGKVSRIRGFGVFVKLLENDIEALIRVSDLSDQPIGKIENFVKVGQTIQAKVIKLDPVAKEIYLSMKDNLDNKDNIIIKKRKRETGKDE